jgi:hypothetical protein
MSETILNSKATCDFEAYFNYPVSDGEGSNVSTIRVDIGKTFDELKKREARILELKSMRDGLKENTDRVKYLKSKLRYVIDLKNNGPAPVGYRNELTLRGRGTIIASSWKVSGYTVEDKIRTQTKIQRQTTTARTDEELQAVLSQAR